MAYNQRNNQISKKENEMYLTERDLNVEIENEKRIRNKRYDVSFLNIFIGLFGKFETI